MKELNHTFADNISVIENNIKLYLNGCIILKLYISNPVAIATDINNSYNTTMKDNFGDIVNGLKGEFTKSKAIELGKLQILNYLNTLKNSISNNYNELIDSLNEYINTLNSNIEIINNTTNIHTLQVRRDTFTKDALSISYMERKTNAVLEEDIRQVSDTLNVTDFLKSILVILDTLPSVSNIDIKSSLTLLKSNRVSIATYIKYLDTTPYKRDDSLLKVISNGITDNDTVIKNIFSNVVLTNTNLTISELVILLINKLPDVLTSLKDSINIVLGNLNDNGLSDSTVKYIDDINTKIVTPYADGVITISEYEKLLNSYSNIVNDSTIIDHNYINSVANVCLLLNAKLYTYMYVYNIVDKTTLNGTLVSKNIKVSG